MLLALFLVVAVVVAAAAPASIVLAPPAYYLTRGGTSSFSSSSDGADGIVAAVVPTPEHSSQSSVDESSTSNNLGIFARQREAFADGSNSDRVVVFDDGIPLSDSTMMGNQLVNPPAPSSYSPSAQPPMYALNFYAAAAQQPQQQQQQQHQRQKIVEEQPRQVVLASLASDSSPVVAESPDAVPYFFYENPYSAPVATQPVGSVSTDLVLVPTASEGQAPLLEESNPSVILHPAGVPFYPANTVVEYSSPRRHLIKKIVTVPHPSISSAIESSSVGGIPKVIVMKRHKCPTNEVLRRRRLDCLRGVHVPLSSSYQAVPSTRYVLKAEEPPLLPNPRVETLPSLMVANTVVKKDPVMTYVFGKAPEPILQQV